jgi:2,4-dienoyl-CoA reductase-like NADH-dependent reductase (Old Yellow Enzyme family)/thioredoxin reductase
LGRYSHIFQTIKIGNIALKNRIEMAPIGPLFGTNLPVSREHYEWARHIARGGAATVTIGDNAVAPPAGVPGSSPLSLASDQVINPLSIFAETIHSYGARASIELNYHSTNTPTQMSLEEIRNIIEKFAAAAYRSMRAGMDIVLIHGAHGQLISQFVSPRVNQRGDDYGGTPGNRARLAIEILEAIRVKTGGKLAIEYRISAEEFLPDGLKLDDQIQFAKLIQDKIDLLHVSAGTLNAEETLPRMIQPTYLHRGINTDFATRFKRELKLPVAAVGSLNLEMAEKIIAGKKADTVALGRTLLADPECVNKARTGREKEIRPCVRCNTCIDRTHSHRLPIRCAVNPLCGREAEFVSYPMRSSKKKVVIIGGGPAGMEAAKWAARRGHEVVLMEKKPCMGGTLTVASAAPFKSDMKKYLDWSIHSTMATPHLSVRLSTEATPKLVKSEKPDTLIIAVGSVPLIPNIPGIDGNNVVWAGDVVTGKKGVRDRVVVVGAGLAGSETALYLAQQEKKVTILDMITLAEIDAGYPHISMIALRVLLRELNVDIITGVKLEQITESGVSIKDQNGKRVHIPCNTVVLALGIKPRAGIIEKFRNLATNVIAIGDCNNEHGNLYTAVTEAFFAAMDA